MGRSTDDPTEEEIAEACERIRLGWSRMEQRRRRYGLCDVHRANAKLPHKRWRPPTITLTADLKAALGDTG